MKKHLISFVLIIIATSDISLYAQTAETVNQRAILASHVLGYSPERGSFIDSRDNRTYKTIKIGNQVWMAENLAFKTDSGSWAFNNDVSFISKYGLLYSIETAIDVCPIGWRLPLYHDFQILLDTLKPKSWFRTEEKVSYKLRFSSGFDLHWGGFINSNGIFVQKDFSCGSNSNSTRFWTSSQDRPNLYKYLSIFSNGCPPKFSYTSNYGSYVRCIKN